MDDLCNKATKQQTYQEFHETGKAPKRVHFILHDNEDWREEITHTLDVTWRKKTWLHQTKMAKSITDMFL